MGLNFSHGIVSFRITDPVGTRGIDKLRNRHEKIVINIPVIFRHRKNGIYSGVGIIGEIHRNPRIIRFTPISDPAMAARGCPLTHFNLPTVNSQAIFRNTAVECQTDDQKSAVFAIASAFSEGKYGRRPELVIPIVSRIFYVLNMVLDPMGYFAHFNIVAVDGLDAYCLKGKFTDSCIGVHKIQCIEKPGRRSEFTRILSGFKGQGHDIHKWI